MLTTPKPKPLGSKEWTDRELVAAIKARSISSCQIEVTVLYKKHAKDVFRMTRSLYDSTEEGIKAAEDLFQDAWQKALEKIDKYDVNSSSSFGAWVKGIADNLFLEGYRGQLKLGNALTELAKSVDTVESDNEDPAESGGELSETGLIDKTSLEFAMTKLSAREQEILIEWYKTYDMNDPGNNLHAETLTRLSIKFGIQKASLRKVKQRAVEKIQRFLKL